MARVVSFTNSDMNGRTYDAREFSMELVVLAVTSRPFRNMEMAELVITGHPPRVAGNAGAHTSNDGGRGCQARRHQATIAAVC